jgi:hypothetical protein
VPEDKRPAALAAVRDHVTDDGVQLGGAIWVTRAICAG